MDYEVVTIEQPTCCCNSGCSCWIETEFAIGWNAGETKEILLTLCGGIIMGGIKVTIEDFLKNSETKYLKMVLENHLGEVVDTQIATARDNFEYFNGKASCYYVVDNETSKALVPGTYYLVVSIMNTLPQNNDIPETTILNLVISGPDGIELTVY